MRLTLLTTACLGAVALAAATATASRPATTDGAFTYRGTVTHVVDGDTLDVRLTFGRRERIRLIGVDTPERGACYAAAATARVVELALAKPVVLRGDATQDTRDRYGRLLAYVSIPSGRDLGHQLLAGGFARVYVYRSPFERLRAYRSAEAGAKGLTAGQSTACAKGVAPTPPAQPQDTCHSSYSPCLPIVGDLDCADVRAMGAAPVRVLGTDPYRLDGDGDGWGCE